jgi:tRNA-dihydrouridine synthase
MHIPIFGNGDVTTPEKAVLMRDEFGLDGAMIGRASIGNPWFFQQIKHFIKTGVHMAPPSIAERVDVAKRHLEMAIAWNGEKVALMETRKHYTSYFKGIPNIKPYRLKMLTAPTKDEVFKVFDEVLLHF